MTVAAPLGDETTITLGLEPTPAGQVGFFPEQFANWRWIARQTQRLAATRPDDEPPRVLNLFAYTGGSTLAAAHGGAARRAEIARAHDWAVLAEVFGEVLEHVQSSS